MYEGNSELRGLVKQLQESNAAKKEELARRGYDVNTLWDKIPRQIKENVQTPYNSGLALSVG